MSQLSISIGNRLGMPIVAAVGGQAYTYNWAFGPYFGQNLSAYSQWDEVQGSGTIRFAGEGRFYPQGTGYHRWITPEQPSDDQFIEATCTNSWATSGDYMGLMVRGGLAVKEGYSLNVGDGGEVFGRWDAAVKTTLDSTATVPITGDVYELRAVGSTITVLKNSVELFSEVDATYASGWLGLISAGLDTNAEFSHLIGGPYPKGNAVWFQERMARPNFGGALPVVAGCLTLGGLTDVNDTAFTSNAQHADPIHDVSGTDMHWFEYDLLQPIRTTGIQNFDRNSHHLNNHWDDVTVFARADPGDDWTAIAPNIDMSDPPNFNYLPIISWPGGAVTYRYYRVEIYSTIHATNLAGTYECFLVGDMS